jgi:hypothetical protein
MKPLAFAIAFAALLFAPVEDTYKFGLGLYLMFVFIVIS